jgi:hypothetical protein
MDREELAMRMAAYHWGKQDWAVVSIWDDIPYQVKDIFYDAADVAIREMSCQVPERKEQ